LFCKLGLDGKRRARIECTESASSQILDIGLDHRLLFLCLSEVQLLQCRLILAQGCQVLVLSLFIADLILDGMREEDCWLFTSFCCPSSQKEIIH